VDAPETGKRSRLRHWWRTGVEAAGTLALPWECPVCGGDGEGDAAPFCLDCRAELLDAASPACPRCATPVGPWAVRVEGCGECHGRRLGFDAAVALGPYQGPIRALCLRLKHEPSAWVAPWLARLLAEARPTLRNEPNALVVAVPLHWRRKWTRGYNQSEALARGLATRLGLQTASVLRRVKPTPLSAGLNRVERAQSLRDAFRVRGSSSRLDGRTILLVDDVLTTGATCASAARALKHAGASRVVAVVVARA
jgi:ComF family protein